MLRCSPDLQFKEASITNRTHKQIRLVTSLFVCGGKRAKRKARRREGRRNIHSGQLVDVEVILNDAEALGILGGRGVTSATSHYRRWISQVCSGWSY